MFRMTTLAVLVTLITLMELSASPAYANGCDAIVTALSSIQTTIDANPPLPSTLKALIIQTAVDIVNANVRSAARQDVDADSNPPNGNDGLATATVGPDFATGWGLVNAQAAVNLMQDSRNVDGVPVPNRMIQDTVHQNGVREYSFVVDQPGPRHKYVAAEPGAALRSWPSSRTMISALAPLSERKKINVFSKTFIARS